MEKKVVLIQGGVADLVRTVTASLLARDVTVVLSNPGGQAAHAALIDDMKTAGGRLVDLTHLQTAADDLKPMLEHIYQQYGSLDAVVNLFVPSAATDAEVLLQYVPTLEKQVFAAGAFMAEKQIQGIVINQFMMPTMFVDHPLNSAASAARGAVTGLTRAACVRFGKSGVRVVGLFVGLLDLPEIKAIASERVLAATTTLGRWINAVDVAETINFMALDSGYITGQMLILDGGMTSGINGI